MGRVPFLIRIALILVILETDIETDPLTHIHLKSIRIMEMRDRTTEWRFQAFHFLFHHYQQTKGRFLRGEKNLGTTRGVGLLMLGIQIFLADSWVRGLVSYKIRPKNGPLELEVLRGFTEHTVFPGGC